MFNLRQDVKMKRSCLMCGKMFNSINKGNRCCLKCFKLVDKRSRNDFHITKIPKLVDIYRGYNYADCYLE